MISKATQLRHLFAKPELIRIVGAHNGLTARLIENEGFEGIWASSLEVSASHAVPDANILTMSDYLNAAISMNDASSLPVVVDVDQGYGNSTNVIHMVKKFEAAGIAGVIMEDKLFPKQNSLLANGRQELASIPEFVGKIMAGKTTQKHPDFMLMARIEALIAGWGMQEALKRANAYAKAGADAILIHSKKENPDEIIEFVNHWKSNIPLVIVPTNYYTLTEEKIKEYPSIKMVIYANHVIRTVVSSVKETLKEINNARGIHTVHARLVPVKDVFELQGTTEMKEQEKKFLKTGTEPISIIIPAAGQNTHESMKDLNQETPMCMLDLVGKPLLQHQKEIFNSLGFTDIKVITGHQKEKINVEGIQKIENKEFEKGHILHSIMAAEQQLKGRTLIIYSDIIFEKEIIERLVKTDTDITLVVDSSVKTSPARAEKLGESDIVLVKTKHQPIVGERVIRQNRENPILKIGKKLDQSEATHEFVGISFFSEKGIADFKKCYQELKQQYQESNFQENININNANFYHLIQYMIEKGHKVNALEIDKGWMEIHTFDDYKRASTMLKQ